MKKVITLTALVLFSFSQQIFAQDLKSEFAFDIEVNLNTPQAIGPILTGTRIIFPAKDGVVKGEKINGKVLAGGGDWALIVDSTTIKLDVRCTIETNDGALIYMSYSGYIHANAKKFASILAGKGNELSTNDYYFRTNHVFETSSPKYAWLNHTIAIGVGRIPSAGKVAYRVYVIK